MPSEEHAEATQHNMFTLWQEGALILILGLSAAWGMVAVALAPDLFPFPAWVPKVMLAAFLVFFTQWAVKGGIPPVMR